MEFNYVKVHDCQLADSGCGEAQENIEPDTAGPHYENSPPDEISLAPFAPSAHSPCLTTAGLWRWLYRVVPRNCEFVADDPDVSGVSAIDCWADSNVPMAS